MAYATRDDLAARFGEQEVADREAMLGAGAADRAIADAAAEMDVSLDNRYLTPITPVPLAVVLRCCDIARYRLLGDSASEDARKRYADARQWLNDVQTGAINLDGVPAKVGGTPEGRVEMLPGRRIFSRGIV
jgi:phage gp36-like protein